MDLSARVWNICEQAKDNVGLYLQSGVGTGRSAQKMSKDVRAMMKNPDKRFRRIRDPETGRLRPSKPMAGYHPGQGVYRSSYKNAIRMTRTETNMAYRFADQARWQKMDFILGYEVKLSASHPEFDICDSMAGKYPKTFVFGGWHPQCYCYTVPIMMEQDKFIEHLQTDKAITGHVKTLPGKATQYIRGHSKQFQNWTTPPYWLRDNFTLKDGKHVPKPGLKMIPEGVIRKAAVIPKPVVKPAPAPIPFPTPAIGNRKQMVKDVKKKLQELENTKEFRAAAKWKAEKDFALKETNRLGGEANRMQKEINQLGLGNVNAEMITSRQKLVKEYYVMEKRYKRAKANLLKAEESVAPKIADVMAVAEKPDLYFSQQAYAGYRGIDVPDRVKNGSEVFARIMGGPKNEKWNKIEVTFKNKRKRAYSSRSGAYVFMGDGPATICHEMAHAAEFNSAVIKKATRDLLQKRCTGDKLKFFNGKEVCWYDEWITPYTGRSYFGGKWQTLPEGTLFDMKYFPDDIGTEVFSMWWTELMQDPISFMRKDPEFFDWGYDLILKLQGI